MKRGINFIVKSLLLALGLAADAFSVAFANGMRERAMPYRKSLKIAGVFGAFQALMPLLGWYFVRGLLNCFAKAAVLLPVISFCMLNFIGFKMLLQALGPENKKAELNKSSLFTEAAATSLDALSAGFAYGEQSLSSALLSSFIIGAVTFILSQLGIVLGKKAAAHSAGGADLTAGIILIFLGFESLV